MRASLNKNLISLIHKAQSIFSTAKTSLSINLPPQQSFFHNLPTNAFGLQNQQAKVIRSPQKRQLSHQNQLCRQQNYSFRILSYQHRQQASLFLSKAFDEEQPLTCAFNKKYAEFSSKGLQNWKTYWSFFIDDLIESGMSIAVFDKDNGSRMVGIVVAKDYYKMPQGYQRKFMASHNIVSQMMGLADFMIQKMDYRCQQILKDKLVIDLFGASIKGKYAGKRLFPKILELNLKVAKEMGFQYAFTYVTNFKSEAALKKLDFKKLVEFDCTDYKVGNHKPFQMVEKVHRRPSIWIKSLE